MSPVARSMEYSVFARGVLIQNFFLQRKVVSVIIWDVLRNLVPFVQLKKRERRPWRSVTLTKFSGFSNATLPKVTLLYGCFSRVLNYTHGTKLQPWLNETFYSSAVLICNFHLKTSPFAQKHIVFTFHNAITYMQFSPKSETKYSFSNYVRSVPLKMTR